MLFPIGDDNTGRKSPPVVVYTLVAINVLVFIIQLIQGDSFTYAYSAVPAEIMNNKDLIGQIELAPGVVITHMPGPNPIYLTLLTSMFMHGGFMHIAGNMLYLWIFGDNIEENFGKIKFLIFYLLCGFAASMAQILFSPGSIIPSLGASGAIAGVLGSYLIMYPHNRVKVIIPLGGFMSTREMPAIIVLGFWIVLQLFSQVAAITTTAQTGGGGVAYMAHIGGFFTGLVLTFLFRTKKSETPAPFNEFRKY